MSWGRCRDNLNSAQRALYAKIHRMLIAALFLPVLVFRDGDYGWSLRRLPDLSPYWRWARELER